MTGVPATRGRIAMSDVVVDDSESVDVVDESKLLPLVESPGILADDPTVESDHSEYPNQGKIDRFDLDADEVPGEQTRPEDLVDAPTGDE
jgi:hypothetical protein